MKKAASIAAAVLITVLVFTALPCTSHASGYSNYEKAVDLKILGLLSGSDNGFDLGRAATRLDGAVMLVRLLGKENQALQAGYTHPFKDVPAWADGYIGYIYRSGLSAGVGEGNFGSDAPVSASEYTVFMLQALGYDNKKDGFDIRNALDKAVKVGLLTQYEASGLKTKSTFLRNDLIGISYNALNARLKASDRTLLDRLALDAGVIYGPAAARLGLYTCDLRNELGNIDGYSPEITKYGYAAKDSNDLFLIMRKFFYRNQRQFKVDIVKYTGDVYKDFKAAYERAYKAVEVITGADSFISSLKYGVNGSVLTVTVSYRFSKEEFDSRRDKAGKALDKARQIVSGLIGHEIPDYDKEKLLHDYIISNARYDTENYASGTLPEDSYTAYGCLFKGIAVCQGYSEAMKLLCDLSGVECRVISGETSESGAWMGHAWNLVRVDGDWYHLDVTFDDPVMGSGENMLTYQYFNLTDSEIGMVSRWERSDYPECSSTRDGYYFRNKLIAGSREEFSRAVKSAAEQKKSRLEIKIEDYSEEKYSDLSNIVFASGNISGFKYSVNEEFGIVSIYGIQYS